jgi:hypothetical protein
MKMRFNVSAVLLIAMLVCGCVGDSDEAPESVQETNAISYEYRDFCQNDSDCVLVCGRSNPVLCLNADYHQQNREMFYCTGDEAFMDNETPLCICNDVMECELNIIPTTTTTTTTTSTTLAIPLRTIQTMSTTTSGATTTSTTIVPENITFRQIFSSEGRHSKCNRYIGEENFVITDTESFLTYFDEGEYAPYADFSKHTVLAVFRGSTAEGNYNFISNVFDTGEIIIANVSRYTKFDKITQLSSYPCRIYAIAKQNKPIVFITPENYTNKTVSYIGASWESGPSSSTINPCDCPTVDTQWE